MSLSEEVQEMVLSSSIGARNVAEAVGKLYPVLLNELNPGNDKHKLGADMLIPLMKACNNEAPMHYLAKSLSGVFIKLLPAQSNERNIIKVVKEFGEFVAEYGKGISDGSLSANDIAKINREGHEALTAIQELLYSINLGGQS